MRVASATKEKTRVRGWGARRRASLVTEAAESVPAFKRRSACVIVPRADTNGIPAVASAWNHRFSPFRIGNGVRRKAKPLEKTVVLVVEDEALIRLATASLLEDVGYTVIEACNADVAIQILESRNDVRAVFTDVIMPGSLDGLRLVQAIRDRWPPIHLLITSGRSVSMEEDLPIKAQFLPKPYTPKHVLKALADVFGHDPEPYQYRHNVMQNYCKVP